MPSDLKQLVYISTAVNPFSRDDIRTLLVGARRRNAELGLSGLLLVDNSLFLQVLEGSPPAVDNIFATISRDVRHRDIDVIYSNDALPERQFARWAMGGKILGEGLPHDFRSLDSRVKEVLRRSRAEGTAAHQLLLDFRAIESAFVDI